MTSTTASPRYTAVRGMNDVLPQDSAKWLWVESVVNKVMASYAYKNIRTPLVERTSVFTRGLGEVTDVVEKEMYSFQDRADRGREPESLSLRPEATAGVVRAIIENNLLYDGGQRVYYMGPMFRRERPQRGRYRQFNQVGAEALGFAGPEVDVELIQMAASLWEALEITKTREKPRPSGRGWIARHRRFLSF